MMCKEFRYVCHLCFPQECEVFKRGECKGMLQAGEVEKVNLELRTMQKDLAERGIKMEKVEEAKS